MVVFVTDWSQHRGQVPPRQAQAPGFYTGPTQAGSRVLPDQLVLFDAPQLDILGGFRRQRTLIC